jgi:hypothetical protein
MCSPEALQFSLGSPLISADALEQLRCLLEMWQASSNPQPDEEEVDEAIGRTTQSPNESSACDGTQHNRSKRLTDKKN